MKCIVAVDKNWGIGKNGDLLFRISADMKHFRAATDNQVVIMGRKTLATLPKGKPLINRENIVLSANRALKIEGTHVCNSPESLLELLHAPAFSDKSHFVIGGAQIYKLLLPYCREAIVTHIRADGGADCFFPDLSKDSAWRIEREAPLLEENGLQFQYTYYCRA